jgi:type IV pilus assembly protein PilQ
MNLRIFFVLLGLCNPCFAKFQLPENKLNLSFRNIELKDVFEILGQAGNIHFIGHQRLEGTTDLVAQDVTWKQTFEMVLRSHGLYFVQNGNMIWVAPPHTIKNSGQAQWDQLNHEEESPQQVAIEAFIVEVDQRFSQELGIKLNLVNKAKNPYADSVQSNIMSDLRSSIKKVSPPVSGAITVISKGAKQILQAELNALESTGQGKIISNPRIVTTHQVSAVIEQGTEIPYTTSSREGSKVHFRKVNLRLAVIPEILPNYIKLDVEISKDSLGKQFGNGHAINTRALKSSLMVEEGGTVMIGGVFITVDREDIIQVPILGDIPLIGHFFQHKEKVSDKNELLIFLTPTLIDYAGNN